MVKTKVKGHTRLKNEPRNGSWRVCDSHRPNHVLFTKKDRDFSLSLFLSFDLEKRRQTFVFYGFDVVVVYILRNKEGEREIE